MGRVRVPIAATWVPCVQAELWVVSLGPALWLAAPTALGHGARA